MSYTDAASIVSEGGKNIRSHCTPLSVDHCTPVKSEHADPLFPRVNNSNRLSEKPLNNCSKTLFDLRWHFKDKVRLFSTFYTFKKKTVTYFWSLSCLKCILVSSWFTRKCSTTVRKFVHNFSQTIFIFSNSQRCMTPSLKTACVTWS